MYFKGTKSDVVVPPKFGDQFADLKLTVNQLTFLYCLVATCGHMGNAALAARLNRTTHHYWMTNAENKEDYTKAFERTKPIAAQRLLDHALERATNGVQEPIFYKGEIVGYVNKYSDNLMAILLAGEYPDKYRKRSDVKVTQDPGGVFKLDPGRDVLSDQKLAALLELSEKALAVQKAAEAAAKIPPVPPASETTK